MQLFCYFLFSCKNTYVSLFFNRSLDVQLTFSNSYDENSISVPGSVFPGRQFGSGVGIYMRIYFQSDFFLLCKLVSFSVYFHTLSKCICSITCIFGHAQQRYMKLPYWKRFHFLCLVSQAIEKQEEMYGFAQIISFVF